MVTWENMTDAQKEQAHKDMSEMLPLLAKNGGDLWKVLFVEDDARCANTDVSERFK